jgi:hypothetical protein
MPNYILRNLPPETWQRFRQRAEREGEPLRRLFLTFIEGYANGRFRVAPRRMIDAEFVEDQRESSVRLKPDTSEAQPSK